MDRLPVPAQPGAGVPGYPMCERGRRAPSLAGTYNAEYGRADVGPMILLCGAQIVRLGSLSGDEWNIVIAAK